MPEAIIVGLNGLSSLIRDKRDNFFSSIFKECVYNDNIVYVMDLKGIEIMLSNYYMIQVLFEKKLFTKKTRICFKKRGKIRRYSLKRWAKKTKNKDLQKQLVKYSLD
jgi:hypothetical protein